MKKYKALRTLRNAFVTLLILSDIRAFVNRPADAHASPPGKYMLRRFSGIEANIISTAVRDGVILSLKSHSRVMPSVP